MKDNLTDLLADSMGEIHPKLLPVFRGLSSQTNARSAIVWLRNKDVLYLLSGFASGDLPITYETFRDHPSQRTAVHLRDLFIKYGALDSVDKHLTGFEAWLVIKLEGGPAYDPEGLLRKFATWHHLKRFRAITETRPLTQGSMASAKQEVTVAANFLEWLHEQGRTASDCNQADIDSWLSTGPTTRSTARTFVRWCVSKGYIRKVDFPYRVPRSTTVLSNEQRIAHIRRLMESPGSDPELWVRVAGVLLLLFAQPITKISSISIDDIGIFIDSVEIRLGKDTILVPDPFADLIRQYVANRPNMNTASNADAKWLFPGAAPGRPLHAQSVMKALRETGIDLQGARNGALRQLVLEIPPAVVAKTFGLGPGTAERHAQAAGATWSSYPGLRERP